MTRHDDALEDPEDEVFRIPAHLPAGTDGDLRREFPGEERRGGRG